MGYWIFILVIFAMLGLMIFSVICTALSSALSGVLSRGIVPANDVVAVAVSIAAVSRTVINFFDFKETLIK